MRMSRFFLGGILLLLTYLQPTLGFAVTLGQIDDFQNSTTEGWTIGVLDDPAQPVIVPDGGPAGDGDHYLLLTAVGGTGAGSKLTVNNVDQWTGNYLAAGVNTITMSVKNLGTTDLSLRLYVTDFAIQFPNTNAAISTRPVFLPANGGWTSVVFRIVPASLTATVGSAQTALADAALLRIFHNPALRFPGPGVVASLGVDNIKASRQGGLPYLPLLLLDN